MPEIYGTRSRKMEVTYDYYRIFYYAAKYKSFSQAATILMSNQPNVTRAIHNLESQLGCRLFIRSNRGAELTPEGERLYIHVLSAMEQFQAAEEELADSSGLSHGSVAIGASETALNIFLLDKLKSFHMTYPGIRLKLYNHSTPEAIEAVKSGKIDFAVVSTPAEVDFPLKQIMLMPFQEILVGGTTFTALSSQELSLREVKNYPLISLGRETMTYKFYNSVFLSHGLDLSPDTEAATADQILPLVKCELGLAFLPQPMAAPSLLKKEIVQIPLKDEIPERQICLVYDSQHPMGAAARELKNTILLGHI